MHRYTKDFGISSNGRRTPEISKSAHFAKGRICRFRAKSACFFSELACVAAPCSRAETWLVDGPCVNAQASCFVWAARRGLRSYPSKRVVFDHFGAFRQQRPKILSNRTSGIVVGWGCNSNPTCIVSRLIRTNKHHSCLTIVSSCGMHTLLKTAPFPYYE